LTEAKKLLQMLVKECETLNISQQAFGFANARKLLHCLETDPLGLEAKLIATAVQTAENFKITKFWTQPEKFWGKPPQLPGVQG
jgi:hypothetical protein